jgi:hypothetical protein
MPFNFGQNYVKVVEFHCVPREIRSGRWARKPVLQYTGEEDELEKNTKKNKKQTHKVSNTRLTTYN